MLLTSHIMYKWISWVCTLLPIFYFLTIINLIIFIDWYCWQILFILVFMVWCEPANIFLLYYIFNLSVQVFLFFCLILFLFYLSLRLLTVISWLNLCALIKLLSFWMPILIALNLMSFMLLLVEALCKSDRIVNYW